MPYRDKSGDRDWDRIKMKEKRRRDKARKALTEAEERMGVTPKGKNGLNTRES